MADHSWRECDPFAIKAEPPPAFDNLADHVFVVMVDLLGIDAPARPESDNAARESSRRKKIMITNFVVELAQTF
jgi:hypothetical protein